MCGRYASAKDPDALVEEFEVEESLGRQAVAARLQRRSDQECVCRAVAGTPKERPDESVVERQLRVVRWGLVPSWAKDRSIGSRMINARAETVAEKPAFRRAFGKRRCLLPADGYYEWYTPTGDNVPMTSRGKPVKQPFYIHRADGHSLAMAGLYEWWHDKSRERDDPEAWLLTATIITTSATDAVGRIHDRMPVVVGANDWEKWLDPAAERPGGRRESHGTGAERAARCVPGVGAREQRAQQRTGAHRATAPGGGHTWSVGADGLWPPTTHDSRGRRRDACAGWGVGTVTNPRVAPGQGARRSRSRCRRRRGGARPGAGDARPWCPADSGSPGSSSRGGWPVAGSPVPLPSWTPRGAMRCRCFGRGSRASSCHWSSVVVAPGHEWRAAPPARLGAVGVVALAFPLHPPGRPERSRSCRAAIAPGAGRAGWA